MTVIVDNGTRSSEAVVSSFRPGMEITYERLAEPGIVSARNRAMRLALASDPEFLAFIDDDEVPEADWLASLIRRAEETGADIVAGPVAPLFEATPPPWAVADDFFSKSGASPGTENLLLRVASISPNEAGWFRSEFNFSGGSDYEYLGRLMANGAKHVVAENALVRESVPLSRLTRRYIWRRGLRDGVAIAQIAALRCKSKPGFVAMVLSRAAAKVGYAFNHFFWSLMQPWRFHRAMADMAAAMAILLRAIGVKFVLYGNAGQSARLGN